MPVLHSNGVLSHDGVIPAVGLAVGLRVGDDLVVGEFGFGVLDGIAIVGEVGAVGIACVGLGVGYALPREVGSDGIDPVGRGVVGEVGAVGAVG